MKTIVDTLLEGGKVQVLKEGFFNDHKILAHDLDEIFSNYSKPSRQPRLYITHDEAETILSDGSVITPQTAWPESTKAIALLNLYREPDGLYVDIDRWLLEKESVQGYIDLSAEVFFFEGEGRVLRGVAMLGIDMPAIPDLVYKKGFILTISKEGAKKPMDIKELFKNGDFLAGIEALFKTLFDKHGKPETDAKAEPVKEPEPPAVIAEPAADPAVVALSASVAKLEKEQAELKAKNFAALLSVKELTPENRDAYATAYVSLLAAKGDESALVAKIKALPDSALLAKNVLTGDGKPPENDLLSKSRKYAADHKVDISVAMNAVLSEKVE